MNDILDRLKEELRLKYGIKKEEVDDLIARTIPLIKDRLSAQVDLEQYTKEELKYGVYK